MFKKVISWRTKTFSAKVCTAAQELFTGYLNKKIAPNQLLSAIAVASTKIGAEGQELKSAFFQLFASWLAERYDKLQLSFDMEGMAKLEKAIGTLSQVFQVDLFAEMRQLEKAKSNRFEPNVQPSTAPAVAAPLDQGAMGPAEQLPVAELVKKQLSDLQAGEVLSFICSKTFADIRSLAQACLEQIPELTPFQAQVLILAADDKKLSINTRGFIIYFLYQFLQNGKKVGLTDSSRDTLKKMLEDTATADNIRMTVKKILGIAAPA